MKIDSNGVEPVWTNNTELLPPNDECLPVIGSCQVSSILSTLEPIVPETAPNMDLLIIPTTDYKIPLVKNAIDLQNNYVILKENGMDKTTDKMKNTTKNKQKNQFEDILYFVCNLCPFLCTKDTKITEHIENAHKNKMTRKLPQLKCPACHNIFYHKMPLRSHLIHDHGVGNSDLTIIISAIVYYSTKNSKENEVNTKPNVVQSSFKDELTSPVKILEETEFDSNSSKCSDTKLVSLPQVDLSENNSEKIFSSLLETDPLGKFEPKVPIQKCAFPSCKVRLQDEKKLTYHMDCHSTSGFQCLECKESFSFWRSLTGHLWRIHKIDMDLYACDKCDYKSVSLSKLNNIHKLIHSDVKAFVCDICQKGFKNSKQLRNHKSTHKEKTDKLLFICEVCLKNFSDRRQLKVHMDVVHKKIKPYLCNYCGYKGSSKSSLKMHIRQHTGERPFACDTCNYKTSDHNSLRRHKLRHTGQKPYKCAHCSYACIQSSTYKVHIKTKHPGLEKDLMFTCHECQFRSVNKDMYMSHMITVHKQKQQSSQTGE